MKKLETGLYGTAEFVTALKKVKKKTVDDLADTMREYALRARRYARENVSKIPPQHLTVKSGDLKKSIKYRIIKRKTQVNVKLYSDIYYAFFQEYGFVNWKTKRRVGPYPFLRPAVNRAFSKWKAERNVKKLIKK